MARTRIVDGTLLGPCVHQVMVCGRVAQPMMQWKYFSFRDIKAALDWAADGNVAVHNTGQSFTNLGHYYETTAHLFAADEQSLKQAAWVVGCQLQWLQVRGPTAAGRLAGRYTDHYALFGTRLDRAMQLCSTEKAA